MEFKGKGAPLSAPGLATACGTLGIGQAELWTVMQVETSGCGFLPDRRLKILFERHKFHEFTTGQFSQTDPDISNPEAGGYVGGSGEYARLERAIALDEPAALKSVSWGLGQVMGFNAERAGFANAEAMVDQFLDGEDVQVLAMAKFIAKGTEALALKEHRWEDFARKYNGPSFKKNKYDEKLANNFVKLTAGPLPDLRLRAAQLYLTYLGFDPHGVDGVIGQNTRDALRAFQTAESLPRTGALDDATAQRLRAKAG